MFIVIELMLHCFFVISKEKNAHKKNTPDTGKSESSQRNTIRVIDQYKLV